jgi:hypothetical protein
VHPELAFELMNHHTSQLRAEARRERIARQLRETRRARRRADSGGMAALLGEIASVPAQRRGAPTTTR